MGRKGDDEVGTIEDRVLGFQEHDAERLDVVHFVLECTEAV